MEPLSDAQRFDWLRLIRAENVGPATFNILLKRYGSATAALAALPELSRRGGMGRPIRIPDTDTIDREFAAVRRNGGAIIARGEDGYPPRLVHIDQPPPMLCVSGRRSTAARPMIAIVGARNASAGGRQIARTFARELGEAGYIIVSGLALGVDACAHEASLATGTVAVLAGAASPASTPNATSRFPTTSAPTACWSPRCRRITPRATAIFRAATASYRAARWARW